jgi:hypothetical protein
MNQPFAIRCLADSGTSQGASAGVQYKPLDRLLHIDDVLKVGMSTQPPGTNANRRQDAVERRLREQLDVAEKKLDRVLAVEA